MEDADKSAILIKYWSPKAHLSVTFLLPASKPGFPSTVTPAYLSTSRPPIVLNFIHSLYSYF